MYACILDGSGTAKQLSLMEIEAWHKEDGVLWAHFDYSSKNAESYINNNLQVDPSIRDALLNEESRPRLTPYNNALLLSFRGVNLQPGESPDDMIAIRIYINENQIISTAKRALLSIDDITASIQQGQAPVSAADFISMLLKSLINRIQYTIEDLDDKLFELEGLDCFQLQDRKTISMIRRQTIMLHRYLVPQCEVIQRLAHETPPWLKEHHSHFVNLNDKSTRYIEELDSIRDRSLVTQDILRYLHSEQESKRLYVLSLITAIFLPLSFFTGLFGINVGGIPGAGNPQGFLFFAIFLVSISFVVIHYLRMKKWF